MSCSIYVNVYGVSLIKHRRREALVREEEEVVEVLHDLIQVGHHHIRMFQAELQVRLDVVEPLEEHLQVRLHHGQVAVEHLF